MTTVLPITPRTPSGLLAALCLSPILAPLNASHDLSPFPSLPTISLQPASPASIASLTESEFAAEQEHNAPHVPVALQILPGSKHRLLNANEARQLTLLMSQYFLPARASSKDSMQASIELAEVLHLHGIRWDRQRRLMGIHLRGIWEQGLRLVGGSEHVVRLGRPGPMDLYIQNSLCSITDEPHPIDPSPLAIPLDIKTLSSASRLSMTTEVSLFQTLPGAPAPIHVHPTFEPTSSKAPRSAPHITTGPRRLYKSNWAKRKNTALRVMTDHTRINHSSGAEAQTAMSVLTAMSAMSAMSMMSVSELKWHFMKRARYRVSKAFAKTRPSKARRVYVQGWEMR